MYLIFILSLALLFSVFIYFVFFVTKRKGKTKATIDLNDLTNMIKSEFNKNWKELSANKLQLDPLNVPDPNYPNIVDSTRLNGMLDNKPVVSETGWDCYVDGCGAIIPEFLTLGTLGFPAKDSCLCCTGNANLYLFAENAGVKNNSLTGLSELLIRDVRSDGEKIVLSIGSLEKQIDIKVKILGHFILKYRCSKCLTIIVSCRDTKEWKRGPFIFARGDGIEATLSIPAGKEFVNLTITPSTKPDGENPYTLNIDKLILNNEISLTLNEKSYYIGAGLNDAKDQTTVALLKMFTNMNKLVSQNVRKGVFGALIKGENGDGLLKNLLSSLLNDLINKSCTDLGLEGKYLTLCEQLGKILGENDRKECSEIFSKIAPPAIQTILSDIYNLIDINNLVKQSLEGGMEKEELCDGTAGKAISGLCSFLRKSPSVCGGCNYKLNIDSITNLDKLKIGEFNISELTNDSGSTIIDFNISMHEPIVINLSDLYIKLMCDCTDILPIPISKCKDYKEDEEEYKKRNWYIGYNQAQIELNYNQNIITGKFEFTKHGTVVLNQLVYKETILPAAKIISTTRVSKSPFEDTVDENDATDIIDNQLVNNMLGIFIIPIITQNLLRNIIPILNNEISKIAIDQKLLSLVFNCVNSNIK